MTRLLATLILAAVALADPPQPNATAIQHFRNALATALATRTPQATPTPRAR